MLELAEKRDKKFSENFIQTEIIYFSAHVLDEIEDD